VSPNRDKSRLPYLDQNIRGKVVPVEKLVKMMKVARKLKLVNWRSPLTSASFPSILLPKDVVPTSHLQDM
jgi:hypothetical protein